MRELLKALRATVVFVLWPLTTYAAGATLSLGATFASITGPDWVSLVVLAAVSGLVALLNRTRKSLEAAARKQAGQTADDEDEQLINWKMFALCHMTGAMFVGFLAFTLCEAFDVNSYIEAAAIALASWRGAKFADTVADGLSDGVKARISAAFAVKEKAE